MPAVLLAIRDLRFAWPGAGRDVLAIDELAVAAGEAVFLHGPSGCGKSTLLGLMAGVLVPRRGTVSLLGQDWAALSPGRRDARRADQVGVIFQQFNLLPYLSVLDNVRLPCGFSTARARRAAAALGAGGSVEAAARALLAGMGLPEALWGRPAARLSVGQQQRVAAARALIGAPALVIADEPTSALDAALRDEFMALVMRPCREHGSALVFVSHDERLAERFDRRLSLPALNRAATAADAAADPMADPMADPIADGAPPGAAR